MELYDQWMMHECSSESFSQIVEVLQTFPPKTRNEFGALYAKAIGHAAMAETFSTEMVMISGKIFQDLMREGK